MTIPLECLKSKQGNRLVIYRPHYAFSAFQKALEKGPTSARSDCKHTTDSLDTLFLNAAGLFPLALMEKPTPQSCLGRSRQEGSPKPMSEGPAVTLATVWLEHHQRQSIHLWHIKIVLSSPTGPQAQPGWTWAWEVQSKLSLRHVVEVVPTPGPERLSLHRTIPKVLESRGVDDTHYEQQQQIQGYHDRKPMAGKPGQLAGSPLGMLL